MSFVWVAQEALPYPGWNGSVDVEVFSTEEKAREYFKKEFANLEHYYDGPAYNWTMPGDEARETEEEIIEQMHYEAEDGSSFLLVEKIEVDDNGRKLPTLDCH